MAIVKVIEIISQSSKSWEDATQNAVTEITHTVRNVQSVYVKDFQAIIENNQIVNYRVTAKVSFVIEK